MVSYQEKERQEIYQQSFQTFLTDFWNVLFCIQFIVLLI